MFGRHHWRLQTNSTISDYKPILRPAMLETEHTPNNEGKQLAVNFSYFVLFRIKFKILVSFF